MSEPHSMEESMLANNALYSILIPAREEGENLEYTINALTVAFNKCGIPYEIVIVNDIIAGSSDRTEEVVAYLSRKDAAIRLINNHVPNHGLGNAIRVGLDRVKGDCVTIVMADSSDDPKDLVKYYRKIQEGYDCVFGDRFHPDSKMLDYPRNKLLLNRLTNYFIALLFGVRYYDFTNACKCYSKKTILGLKPILAHHFNITVELPLKAIVRGYRFAIVPTNWYGRRSGISKLRLRKMARKYLFTILVVFLERLLARNDYYRKD